MERQKYLIDSNAVVDYLGNKLPAAGMAFMNAVVDDVPNISVVTRIEVLGFNAPDEQAALLIGFIEDSTVLGMSEEIVERCIVLRKQFKIKLPDVIIAATAIEHGFSLITRNIKDFAAIPSLTVVNPSES